VKYGSARQRFGNFREHLVAGSLYIYTQSLRVGWQTQMEQHPPFEGLGTLFSGYARADKFRI
jgi:hypothetical protein